MDRETMEYSLNQNVQYEFGGSTFTGKIVGGNEDKFIVLLDRPLSDGSTAALVPSGMCVPLSCHWCRDTQRVVDTPFTLGQHEADAIPTKPCPYCTERQPAVL